MVVSCIYQHRIHQLHNCSSVNKCGDTMTSNKGVADRAVDLLRNDPTIGAKKVTE
jgi:hypothetical protein